MSKNTGSYFKGGGFFEKLMRFFNILEPGRIVLSISKIAMWLTLIACVYIAFTSPAYFAAAVMAFGGSLLNYAYRRKKQYDAGVSPYPVDQNYMMPSPYSMPPPAAPTPVGPAADSALANLDLGGPLS